ncbi:MAG: hypothetical protein R2778_04750 [Saprospiraceae bacterium]
MKCLMLLPLLFMACSVDSSMLSGDWHAVGFYMNGQDVPATLDSVKLSFTNSGNYTFKSIGFYEEKGSFRLAGKYLFLKDTTADKPAEKVFQVLYLSEDTLKLGMESSGQEQTVFFSRN